MGRLTKARAERIAEEYLGRTVQSVEIAEDPKVDTCFILRCTLIEDVGDAESGPKLDKEVIDLMVTRYGDPDFESTWSVDRNVEEVELETWPPVSGELRFL